MSKNSWKKVIDLVIMLLTAVGGYLGASASSLNLF